MATQKDVYGMVKSEKGFYIGDICYVLEDDIYYDVWGKQNFPDGIIEVPGTGLSFAVGGTAYGDGTYSDNHGNYYEVDAGVIGVVPLELVKKIDLEEADEDGNVVYTPGEAEFSANKGIFDITLPDGETIYINTADDEEDEEDDDWDEDWEDEDTEEDDE